MNCKTRVKHHLMNLDRNKHVITVGLSDQKLHTRTHTEEHRDDGGGKPEEHPAAPRPITGAMSPPAQAQRGAEAQRQAGTPIKDPEKGHPIQAPLRAVLGEPRPRRPGVTPIPVGHQEQLSRSPLGLREVTAPGRGTRDGHRARQDLLRDV